MSENTPLLEIKNLRVGIQDKVILQDVNLTVRLGETHVIMGPNGSGKSTLAQVLARKSDYQILGGSVLYQGVDLLSLSPEECAWQGIFLGFQYPVAIPGVSNIQFLKASINAIRTRRNQPRLDAIDLLTKVRQVMADLGMSEELLYRAVNDGFSGGEKKRNEILQMTFLEPVLAILDETDSGLDIDALKVVAKGINALRHPTRSMLLITHYQRLLEYIEPTFIHVLAQGKIVRSGDKSLALELEERGYHWLTSETT